MSNKRYTDKFKLEAVKQVSDRGKQGSRILNGARATLSWWSLGCGELESQSEHETEY